MTVTKHKDTDWKSYLRQIAESPSKPSDIERTEFAGYLLRGAMELDAAPHIFKSIFSQRSYEIADVIANFMIAESPDTIGDLLQSIKSLVVDHYSDSMDELIKTEEINIKHERVVDDPRDEYDPNDANYTDPYQGN